MSKFSKVVKFIKKNQYFTWKQFTKKFDDGYPCTETTYLSLLVKGGFVSRYERGKYKTNDFRGVTYAFAKHVVDV